MTIYSQAVELFGPLWQLRKFQEECLEAALAVAHYQEDRPDAEDRLLEEIADVEIMLAQMRIIFDVGRIETVKEQKLARLKERLDALQG